MKYIIGSLTIAAMLFGGTANAQAADIASEANCCSFVTGPFTQAGGEISKFVNPPNADAVHNVTSTAKGPGGNVLFASETVAAGKSSPIEGTQYLTDGTYPFICTIHGLTMSGDLVVSGGTPQVRPEPTPKVTVSFPAQKLSKVRNSGRISVKVKGVTDASGIALTVSKRQQKLGSASGISVSEGRSKTVSVKLTSKGKKAIKNGDKVTFSAKATPKGGKPATTSRTLR